MITLLGGTMRYPSLVAIAAVAFFAVMPAVGQELHTPFCLHGCPLGAPASNDTIVRSIYVLSVNHDTKFAGSCTRRDA